jgi:hypothetical protein
MPPDPRKAENPYQLFKQAAASHRKGDLGAAERLYSKLLKARPERLMYCICSAFCDTAPAH